MGLSACSLVPPSHAPVAGGCARLERDWAACHAESRLCSLVLPSHAPVAGGTARLGRDWAACHAESRLCSLVLPSHAPVAGGCARLERDWAACHIFVVQADINLLRAVAKQRVGLKSRVRYGDLGATACLEKTEIIRLYADREAEVARFNETLAKFVAADTVCPIQGDAPNAAPRSKNTWGFQLPLPFIIKYQKQ